MGTVRYMSPEQVRGQEVDLRTDIYSLGATMYESLVGDTPFDGSTHFEIMTKHLSEAPKPPSSHGIEIPQIVEDAIMRSLAKKATDRFENAREMRKILEAALKEGDLGLHETQRLSRDILNQARPTKDEQKRAAPSVTPTTANDLADELEPGVSSSTRPRRSKLPLILGALVVLGSGAAAAVFVLNNSEPPKYAAHTRLKGVTLVAGEQRGDIFVETDGKMTLDELEQGYRATLAELIRFNPTVEGKRDVVEEIVAIPQADLCHAKIQRASQKACSPSDTFTLALRGEKRQLLISDDRSSLAANLRAGVASAACDFQYILPSATQDNLDRIDKICDMTKEFAAPH
jgi:hypothetical protein